MFGFDERGPANDRCDNTQGTGHSLPTLERKNELTQLVDASVTSEPSSSHTSLDVFRTGMRHFDSNLNTSLAYPHSSLYHP